MPVMRRCPCTVVAVACMVIVATIQSANGYAFSTKSATTTTPAFGQGQGQGQAPMDTINYNDDNNPQAATTTPPAIHNGITNPTTAGMHTRIQTTIQEHDLTPAPAPVFSGFAHALPANAATAPTITSASASASTTFMTTASPPSTNPKPAPIFSGFGHATTANTASSTSTTPAMEKPPIMFSGFDHALQDKNGVAATAAPAPSLSTTPTPKTPVIFSGFGHAIASKPVSQESFSSLNGGDDDDYNDDHDDDDHDSTNGMMMDPDLLEASQLLHAARDKVQLLKQELEQKANQQKVLVQELRTELQTRTAGYEARLERLADQFQEFKFAAHRDKMELSATLKLKEDVIRAEAALKEQTLQQEISKLEQELIQANQQVQMAQDLNMQLQDKYQSLQANFTEMRHMYMEEQMEWEDRLEMEQNARLKDRSLAETILRQAQDEASRKLQLARRDGTVQLESLKSEKNNQIWQKETQLQAATLQLKRTVYAKEILEDMVEDLETEREDLSALTKQTAKVVKEVAKSKASNTIQKAKNFFRRM